jgi:hypothetical protein|tara:strand:- start:6416 stop:6757 length:342 start_codon:yes stop_codon:yes gene_type:complete
MSQNFKEKAKEELKTILKKGDRIYYHVNYVLEDGTARYIDFYKFEPDDKHHTIKYYLTYQFAQLLQERVNINETEPPRGMYVEGCGMDMGFHVISSVSMILFDDFYALKYEFL